MITTMLRTGLKKQNWRVPCLQNLKGIDMKNYELKKSFKPQKTNVVALPSQAACTRNVAGPEKGGCQTLKLLLTV